MKLFIRIWMVFLASVFLSGCATTVLETLWVADCHSKARYQTPEERPYIVREVTIQGGDSEVMLAGELTMPHGSGPFPGVVLISGSELADRDSMILGHKPFLVLADFLTKRGYAVFRHDDRGYGESTGDSSKALDADFSTDAAAALKWLRTQDGIDVNRVGFIGHSQGGFKAILASQTEPSDFMVMMVGGVEGIGGLLVRQSYDLAKAAGASDDVLELDDKVLREVFKIIRSSFTAQDARLRIEKYASDEGVNKQQTKALAAAFTTPWMMAEITQSEDLFAEVDVKMGKLIIAYKAPVLALYGGKDLIVSADFNAPRTEPLLTHKKSKVIVLPEMNHFMQPVPTGQKKRGIEEVCEIETTFDPKALNIIGQWLDEVVR